jgi:hypothetical protein
MAYWWVSQNKKYHEERDGGFLWAPKHNSAGFTPSHWAKMNDVLPGDVIFSYFRTKIVAVSVAKTQARDSPNELGDDSWDDEGRKIDVEYEDVKPELSIAEVVADIQPLLPQKYSPLNRKGTGNQGYLLPLPPGVGRLLLGRIAVEQPNIVEDGISDGTGDATERRALILSRIGQGRFRDSLISLWGGRCAVTGLDAALLLRASHIKPWRDPDNRERLDPYNGLLLSPCYDAAFDAGLIAFADDGAVVFSDELLPSQVDQLGICSAARIKRLDYEHRAYLRYHREQVFRS